MFRKILTHLTLPLLLIFTCIPGSSVAQSPQKNSGGETGILQKLLVVGGSAAMDLDLNKLNGTAVRSKVSKSSTLRFEVAVNSFFTLLVFNDDLRAALPGSMGLVSQNAVALPSPLSESYQQLLVESAVSGEPYELVIRDGKSGFVFFNIEGNEYDYDAATRVLGIKNGRLLISEEFAKKLGRTAEAGSVAGSISVTAMTFPIEVTTLVNGAVESAVMPALPKGVQPSVGTVPGPDVIVGDLNGLSQPDTASAGTQVGISVGTDSCNLGVENLDWFATPDNNHPVIPQNLYRMKGGTTNDERFEQIGQSSVKHAFTALKENICGLGCNNVGGTHLGSGCSDPYVVSLNSGGSSHNLGSRAWINPFTGAFPRADSATPPNSHTGHSHNAVSHRMLVEIADLNTNLNSGASYYAEAQYITPHEYVWCQARHGECNMFNNVSYRRYTVTGTTGPFSFGASTYTTVRTQPAVSAWTGATINTFEPDPGNDGIASIAYKVTNPSAGVWHYEYAVYNQNLDRAIRSFSVPLGCGIIVSNLGFHAPPQHPAWTADGTVGNAGFSSTPWTQTQTAGALTWNSETFAQNPNANAIRWGTLYNFRFDSNQPPQAANATVGFLKTGALVTVPIQAPSPNCTPLQLTSAASQKMHGALGPFPIPLPLGGGGVEDRISNGDHTIVFTFNNTVVSGNAGLTAPAGGSTSGSPIFSGNTMTVNLTGVTDAQEITVTLSSVTDSFGQVLPNTGVGLAILSCDVDGTDSVSGSDVNQTKGQVGTAVSSSNCREDVDLDGSITGSDVNLVKTQVGKTFPGSNLAKQK